MITELGLHHFSIRCPRCGGAVYRHISWLHQITYLLPLHWFAKARYECFHCGGRYLARNNVSDYLLSCGFVLSHFLLWPYAWVPAVFLLVWLCYALVAGRVGPAHTFIATSLVATLLFMGLAISGTLPRDLLTRHASLIYGAMGLAGFFAGYVVLWIDKITAPELEARTAPARETP